MRPATQKEDIGNTPFPVAANWENSMTGELVAMLAAPQIELPGAEPTALILLRWIHLAAGITWIGLLYFFNLVNVPFQKELDARTRLVVVPNLMPRALWWVRWSSVVTVLVGIA